MSSATRSELARLLDETERNAKRIEAVKGKFPMVVLNEWRYATRHVVNLLEGDGDASERERAENHLARAYFDSCDILIDCLLDRARLYLERYSAYQSALCESVQDWPAVRKTIRDVHKLHAQSQGFVDEEKRERYAELAKAIAPLEAAIDALDAASDDIASAVRRQRRKDFLVYVSTFAAVAGAVAAILALFL